MIDLEMVGRIYDVGQATGVPVMWGLFDKTVLLPLEQLPDAVAGETGQVITLDDLQLRAKDGWFEVLHSEHLSDGPGGVPLYIPSRIGFLLKLEREGWEADELRHLVRSEEWLIDNVLTVEDQAYSDDDLETLITYARARLDALETGTTTNTATGEVIERSDEIAQQRQTLGVLEKMREVGIPEHLAERVKRDAFNVRAANDCLRVFEMQSQRARAEAGYSPLVCFKASTSGPDGFKGEVGWEWTLQAAMAEEEGGGEAPLRVPGFRLEGGRVTTTKTVRPSEYAELWRSSDVEGYLNARARVLDEKRCPNCHNELPEGADLRRSYCSERCRNAIRQRRYRERHPEAIERAQQRYWGSIDLDEPEK